MLSNAISDAFWRSWIAEDGVHSFDGILSWILERNRNTPVSIKRISLEDCAPWHYDYAKGYIANATGAFFQVVGLQQVRRHIRTGEEEVVAEQPIIVQNEVGYLGIIAKEFDGVMHLLMQAKIEPGNVNKVQISPTVQATRSNFMQLHGGNRPEYLDYFLNSEDNCVLVDQIQSEQSTRFLGKRNRNVVLVLDKNDPIEVLPTHMWMSLGQLMRLMKYDNLVNMDTRTVVSCIPWSFLNHIPSDVVESLSGWGAAIAKSYSTEPDRVAYDHAYTLLNSYKMFDTSVTRVIPLGMLADWEILHDEVRHKVRWPFRVIFCDISIEGREVRRWCQPLFEPEGKALFGLLGRVRADGAAEFLIKVHPEIGCFDRAEFGPTVQREAGTADLLDSVESYFLDQLDEHAGVYTDVLLSEEGGRFFCEQNRNVVMFADAEGGELPEALRDDNLPEGYLWLDLATIELLLSSNNVLNIQLRNLLALLDIKSDRSRP